MSTSSIISFQKATKFYGNKCILQPFTLKIQQGECITIVGNSGGGKTTLLKMVNGLLLPDAGQVIVLGEDTKQTNLITLRRQIGYVVQGAALFPHMNVAKNINYVPQLQNKRLPQERLEALMHLVDLDVSLLKRHPNSLSGGQQQRVGIARALATSPKIMLMDEPFGAVDEITRKTLQEAIMNIHQQLGTTILFVTHDIQEALKLGTRVLIINNGHLEQIGTPQEVIHTPQSPYVDRIIHS